MVDQFIKKHTQMPIVETVVTPLATAGGSEVSADPIPIVETVVTPAVSADPISAIANAAQALFHLITATIPSDELQRERFKLRNPIIYAHIRMRAYRQILRHLRFRWHEPVEPYVRLVAGAFSKDEQDYIITLVRATLKRD